MLRRRPWVVVDGAHNAYSMHRLGEALREYFAYQNLTLVLGFSGDKDIPGMAAEAAAMTGDVILAASRHPRSIRPAMLLEEFRKNGVEPRLAGSVGEAVKLALAAAGPGDLICGTGSMFVIAEVMEEVGG